MRIVGDCREVLRDLPKGSVQTCITSPPYYGLRDYGVRKQIGLERTPELFIEQMVNVFRLVWDVLADDGTLWLNLGDSYAGSTMTGGNNGINASGGGNGFKQQRQFNKPAQISGLKPKDLIGMPWRVAFALQADGWYLRSDIIWHKPNPMPESVRDRPTKAHEYLFLLTKSPQYFYDAEAVREPHVWQQPGALETNPQARQAVRRAELRANGAQAAGQPEVGRKKSANRKGDGTSQCLDSSTAGRNRRTVWTITPKPFPGAHFATFPPKLVEPCILAGTSERGHCPVCSARWVRDVEKRLALADDGKTCLKCGKNHGRARLGSQHMASIAYKQFCCVDSTTTGWRPTCDHKKKPVPDVVLDPFGGSGTTAQVAQQLGRDWVLIELSRKYARLIDDRMREAA
jgi:DNA modification methylase